MSDHGRRRLLGSTRVRVALAALVMLIGAVALGARLYERSRTGSIYHPHARFVPQPTPTLPTRGPARFAWPLYGYTANHTRFFPAPANVRPPFKQLWVRNSHTLLEFPPVLYGEDLFQLGDDAVLDAIDKRTGRELWSRSLGHLSASSPAVTANTVYVTILYSGHPTSPGRVIALNSATGAIRWWHALPSGSESSPLVYDGRVFFGSQNGTVFALNDRTGALIWSYHAASAVKASPTVSGGILYFGDYSGRLQAISAQTGRRFVGQQAPKARCSAAATSTRPQPSSTAASSSATPTDASTPTTRPAGSLDWAVQTGAYVYASPAVTNAPGLGPDHLHRLLQRHLLRDQRALWSDQLALRRPRAHLRLGDDHRACRLLRRPWPAPHLRPGHLHRTRALRKGHRRVRPDDQRRRRRVPHGRHRPLRARARGTAELDAHRVQDASQRERACSHDRAISQGDATPLHEPPEANARLSEKRAVTITAPLARTLTSVHPPGAGDTQPAPRVSVQ